MTPQAAFAVTLTTLLPSAPLAAQGLEQRVAAVERGSVRLSYAARAGVCGVGDHTISISHDDSSDWEPVCQAGPVRLVLRVSDHRVTKLSTHVGGRWRAPGPETVDLGTVPAEAAAEYLLGLATQGGPAGRDAILAATLADSVVVWPDLLRLARNASLDKQTREGAVFWLGQQAAAVATRALDSVATDDSSDRGIRDAAVFALSQRPNGEGVPALIRLARTSPHREVRRKALFWLGQSGDPRALALFEDLLSTR